MSDLPPYSVRISARAKRAQLKVVPPGRVEVVLPKRFNPKHVPGFVAEHQAWLQRHLQSMQSRYMAQPLLPETIELAALAETWRVVLGESPRRRYRKLGTDLLQVDGANSQQAQAQLQAWLHDRARQVLPGWLAEVSEEIGLPFNRVTIRAQRTRWGSCSSRKNINLNRALLFLAPEAVRYLMIHELCHTVHMNHSPHYWSLVESLMPGYEVVDRGLRQAMQQLPHWALPRL